MIGAVYGAVAVALLGGTGLAVAMSLRLRGWPRLLLAAYVVAFGEVVVLTLALSPFGAVTRVALLVALAVVFLGAAAALLARGRPRRPALPVRALRELAEVRVLLVLAGVVALVLAYAVALVVGTPPTTWDSMTYHLARAALWRQAGGVGDIANSYDQRLDYSPPNAEIVLTFVLEVTRNEHFTGFVQLAAALALATGVFAVARLVGLARAEAAFGALLVLTLPIVAMQASTTQNDLVAASLLAAATVFVVGSSRGELALAALATALAVGTKIPAAFGVPVLAALSLVAPPRSARVGRLVAVAVGAALGSYWYVANLVRTGHPLGENVDPTGLVALFEPKQNVLSAYARVLDAFDVSGAERDDLYLYVLVGAVVAAVLLFAARWRPLPALLTGALVAAPLAVVQASHVLWRPFAKLHNVLGEPDGNLPAAGWERQDLASETVSWFGPLGILLVVGVGAAAVVLLRRRSLPWLALALAAAPVAWLVLISLSIGYDEWQGRFFVFPVALSAALWGLLLRVRQLAVATVAIAATTAALTLVHYFEKPSGIRLLEREDIPPAVWTMSRWEAQGFLRPEMWPVLEYVEETLPDDASVALALRGDDFGYPYFGSDVSREVKLAPRAGDGGIETDWLVATPRRAAEVDPVCWRAELETPEGWKVFRAAAPRESC